MPEYELTFTFRYATVTLKSFDPAFIDKWWKTFKPIITPDPELPPKNPKQTTIN
jgi:hypothetical protein